MRLIVLVHYKAELTGILSDNNNSEFI